MVITRRMTKEKPQDFTPSSGVMAPNPTEFNMESFSKAMEGFCKAMTPPTPPPPKPDLFSGDIFQEPEVFMNQLRVHIEAQKLTEEGTKNEIVQFLTGEAATWYANLRNQIDSFESFRELFTERYNSEERNDMLQSLLYGVSQKQNERAVEFILRKKKLCTRLNLNWEESRLINLIRRQLRPDYRIALGPHPLNSINELRKACIEIDNYVHGDTTQVTQQNKSPVFVKPAAPKWRREMPSRENGNIPKCHYCPERHFHRNCPVLRERYPRSAGNEQQAALQRPEGQRP